MVTLIAIRIEIPEVLFVVFLAAMAAPSRMMPDYQLANRQALTK
jgi:hypothetical protein